jgi:hypothetical protein
MNSILINSNDLHFVEQILKMNPSSPSGILSDSKINDILTNYKKNLENETLVISVLFDKDIPLLMYTGSMYKSAATWILAGPRVLNPTNSYITTARLAAPALDTLITHMENQLFLKFYQIDPGNRHIKRKKIMDKFSTKLSKYDYIDEVYIPENKKTNFDFFDNMAINTVGSVERMIRLFYLKQDYRDNLLSDFYNKIK